MISSLQELWLFYTVFISNTYSEIKFDGRYRVTKGIFIVNEQMILNKTFLFLNFTGDFLCTFSPIWFLNSNIHVWSSTVVQVNKK